MEKVPTKETLSERVCQCIRRDIITGHLKAGSTINIQHLCDRYETSEPPTRLALTGWPQKTSSSTPPASECG